MLAGGERQLSQLPQKGGGSSPKWRKSTARRQPAVSTSAPNAEMRVALAGLPRGLDLADALAGAGEILGAPEQGRHGRIAIAPGAAALLIIALDRLGQAGMYDEADVRLVDAHAEGDGRDHDHLLAGKEGGLVGGADLRIEPGMIRENGPACHRGPRLSASCSVAARGGRIDDTGAAMLGENVADLALHPVARLYGVADIGPGRSRR